jgi:flavin reductase (DIM6/NTAB) family NADH-FMN oxidoreductase RutF
MYNQNPACIMRRLRPGEVPLQEIHGILLGAIAPRPIAFVSTVDEEGRPNLSPFSFFNIFSTNPPVVVFSPSRRGRDSTTKHTYENVKVVPEAVINLVNFSMVQQANLASSEFPEGVNEFVKAGFTMLPSEIVKPPRVMESPVQLECRVLQVITTGTGPAAGNLVVCEILLVHVDEAILDGSGKIDQQKTDWVGRMGGDWYVRASGSALFRVSKPPDGPAVGIDGLPEVIRSSRILTGNDLGRMGLIKTLPSDEEILACHSDEKYLQIFSDEKDPARRRDEIHRYAQQLLDNGEFLKAVAICTELLA